MKPAERGFHRPRAAGSSPRTQEFTYVQLEIFVWQIRLSFANKAPVCLSQPTNNVRFRRLSDAAESVWAGGPSLFSSGPLTGCSIVWSRSKPGSFRFSGRSRYYKANLLKTVWRHRLMPADSSCAEYSFGPGGVEAVWTMMTSSVPGSCENTVVRLPSCLSELCVGQFYVEPFVLLKLFRLSWRAHRLDSRARGETFISQHFLLSVLFIGTSISLCPPRSADFGFSAFTPDGLRLAYFNNGSWLFVLLLRHFISIRHWLTSR